MSQSRLLRLAIFLPVVYEQRYLRALQIALPALAAYKKGLTHNANPFLFSIKIPFLY
ncbi:hypothetical protein ACEV8Q_07225 [Vibrio parahaemolyticus]|uniref:hypothetical protein n=1 Tax=Vibrio parahaemolyticus TaxID=670 RepID=UPI00235F95BA|nr:hypothetical protein [Vibrio parahaemolyticus]